MKSQGTCKVGSYCTAHMTVRENQSGQVYVEYNSTHINHDIELAHLTVPEDVRLEVASKLQQGVKMDRILDDIRNSVGLSMERKHLVSKQDIHNIQRQYNISGVKRHANDHISLQAWIEDCKMMEYNPIVIFKQQGEEQDENVDDMSKNDFLIGIQTEFQRDMMVKFGNNIDTTHGTNMYDFNLLTLMVMDEFGEGLPVLWAICNRKIAQHYFNSSNNFMTELDH